MQEAVDNCADPANVDVSMSLAVDADIVITGLVVVNAGTAPVLCAPSNSTLKTLPADATPSDTSGPDLLLDMRKNSSGSSKDGTTLLVAVQCVHKGALACRRNSADLSALADAAGRCVVAVKIPSQTTKSSCLAYPGYRYDLLLQPTTTVHQLVMTETCCLCPCSACSAKPCMCSEPTNCLHSHAVNAHLAGLFAYICCKGLLWSHWAGVLQVQVYVPAVKQGSSQV